MMKITECFDKCKSWTVLYLCTGCLVLCALLTGCGRKDTVISLEKETAAGEPVLEASKSAGSGKTDGASRPDGGTAGASKAETSAKTTASSPEDAGYPDTQEAGNIIAVYVCGAVAEPKVVELPEGSRAREAVEAAGGFLEEADETYVNLASRLKDGEKLFIPTREEAAVLVKEQENQAVGLVNINQADAKALCTLPGIGESRAGDIIGYREKNGGFRKIEDIMKVPGIKENAFEKIRDKITVE